MARLSDSNLDSISDDGVDIMVIIFSDISQGRPGKTGGVIGEHGTLALRLDYNLYRRSSLSNQSKPLLGLFQWQAVRYHLFHIYSS